MRPGFQRATSVSPAIQKVTQVRSSTRVDAARNLEFHLPSHNSGGACADGSGQKDLQPHRFVRVRTKPDCSPTVLNNGIDGVSAGSDN